MLRTSSSCASTELAGTFVAIAANALTNSDRLFSETVFSEFSFVVPLKFSLSLQMDKNIFVSSTAYLTLKQQSTNGEHTDRLVNFSKHKRLVIAHSDHLSTYF